MSNQQLTEEQFEQYLQNNFDSKKIREYYRLQKKKEDNEKKLINSTKLTLPGKGAKPILQSDIERALKQTKSLFAAARYLGITYPTFKKYVKLYCPENIELYKNKSGKNIVKAHIAEGGWYTLDDILNNKYLNYDRRKLKERLIHAAYLEEKCNLCGYEERRITDYKIPLELDFIDGNKNNFNLNNLQLLCYNCFFLCVGNKKLKT